MMLRKLVDRAIVVVAFVLLGTVCGVIVPRVAQAAPAWWEFCDTTMKTCPANTQTCFGCTPFGLLGTCQLGNIWDLNCTRSVRSCWNGTCSCNTDAC